MNKDNNEFTLRDILESRRYYLYYEKSSRSMPHLFLLLIGIGFIIGGIVCDEPIVRGGMIFLGIWFCFACVMGFIIPIVNIVRVDEKSFAWGTRKWLRYVPLDRVLRIYDDALGDTTAGHIYLFELPDNTFKRYRNYYLSANEMKEIRHFLENAVNIPFEDVKSSAQRKLVYMNLGKEDKTKLK